MHDCSEAIVLSVANDLAKEIGPNDHVFLEGPMGAGKTTFARALLQSLGVRQPPEGSPSFAIAHEYDSKLGLVVHIDFYRIRDEAEIDDAGIPSYFWERDAIVISEWLSSRPEFEKAVLSAPREGAKNWCVRLNFPHGAAQAALSESHVGGQTQAVDVNRRDLLIEQL